MYSAVLVLALTAGSDTVDFGGRNRCNGCTNVCSSVCSGVVSHGCTSNGCTRSHGGLFNRHGCNNGCTTVVSNGCTSSHGCANSCSRGGLFSRHRNNGCNNPCGCTTTVVCSGGVIVTPTTPKTMPKSEPVPDPKKKAVSAPATIVVNLPAEARLFVDGSATTSTSDIRTLVTPELQYGSTYVYTVRAEIVRDGQVVTETQNVNVVGGQTSNVRFNFSQTVASR